MKEKKEQTIAILGLGYVGLTLAATFAEEGYAVVGVDTNEGLIEQLRRGEPHFFEPGLKELMSAHRDRLQYHAAIPRDPSPDIYVIAVGTNITKAGQPDFSHLDNAGEDIGAALKEGDLVILRSTVALGTTRNRMVKKLEEVSCLTAGKDFFVAFAPERTIEGKALEELRTLPQIIAGYTRECTMRTAELFRDITNKIVLMHTLEEAEMAKLVSNAYRDLSFAFANNLAIIAAEHNLDVNAVIAGANEGYHRNNIPLPSPGVGGYCLTKDPQLLVHGAGSRAALSQMILEGRRVNEHMPMHVAETVHHFFVTHPSESKRIIVLGLAFKSDPATSDVRHSPSEQLVLALRERGYEDIAAYDPHVSDNVFQDWGLERLSDINETIRTGDVLIFMHRGEHYRDLDIAHFGTRSGVQLLVDPWALYKKEDVAAISGLAYANLGFRSFHDHSYDHEEE